MAPFLQRVCLLAAMCAGPWSNSVLAQTFSMRSLEGPPHKVHLLLDEAHNRFAVVCAADTFRARNVWGITTAAVLNDRFLRVVYRARAGTGIAAERTVLLSVKGHTLCPSLQFMSRVQEQFLDFSTPTPTPPAMNVSVRYRYEVQFAVSSASEGEDTLLATVHEEGQYASHPKRNYTRDFTTTLRFESRAHVFCTSQKALAHVFTLRDPAAMGTTTRQLKGLFPVVELGNHYQYYFIDGAWYSKSAAHFLTKQY